jgi:histidinol-phosphate aminotransferase
VGAVMTYEYEKVLTPPSGLRLHLNENTAGCSPKVIEALRALTRTDISFYPDYDAVIAACALKLRVVPEQLVLTNGLDEGILAITVEALRERGAITPEAVVVVPAFDMYASTAAGVGARVVEVPLEPEFAFPVERIQAAIGPETRLLFLTSPNNPTGLSIPRGDIVRVARAAPHVRVLVDEAYADFGGTTLVGDPDIAALPNVFIGRTFAKAYGLAGVRAGAVIGDMTALEPLRRIVPPFSLNICATIALAAGLADVDYYDWYLGQVRTSKTLLYEALSKAGVPFWLSDANFVLARFGDRARAVVDGLAARGVYVRDKSRDPACLGCIRITTGVVEHTEACVRALEEVLCGAV